MAAIVITSAKAIRGITAFAQDTFVSYMFVLAALILLVMYFTANKIVQKRLGSGTEEALTYSCLRGFVSALIFFVIYVIMYRALPAITPYSLWMSALLALCVCAYTLLGFRILSLGSLSIFTVFLMLGGMIIPYLYGVIWLNEGINVFRIVGIVLMVISLFLPLIGTRKSETAGEKTGVKKRIIFGVICFAVFMLNGIVSVISKTHALKMSDQRPVLITFVMLCTLSNGVLSLISLIAVKLFARIRGRKDKESASPETEKESGSGVALAAFRSAFVFIVLAAAFDGISFMFQQFGASKLPASVMYPIQTGGSIVLTALVGFLLFKEKPTKIALIGLAITFAATFLFLF